MAELYIEAPDHVILDMVKLFMPVAVTPREVAGFRVTLEVANGYEYRPAVYCRNETVVFADDPHVSVRTAKIAIEMCHDWHGKIGEAIERFRLYRIIYNNEYNYAFKDTANKIKVLHQKVLENMKTVLMNKLRSAAQGDFAELPEFMSARWDNYLTIYVTTIRHQDLWTFREV